MLHFQSTSDLTRFGVNPLTGEACSYSMRVLCDLSKEGVDFVSTFLGLRVTSDVFAANWNSTVNGNPAVASVMLTRGTLKDLIQFGIFYIEKCDVLITMADSWVVGLKATDEYYERYLKLAADDKRYSVVRNPMSHAHHPSVAGRNIHSFTGRTL